MEISISYVVDRHPLSLSLGEPGKEGFLWAAAAAAPPNANIDRPQRTGNWKDRERTLRKSPTKVSRDSHALRRVFLPEKMLFKRDSRMPK